MMDFLDLALKYGGFTSLDKVYLENILSPMTAQQQFDFITPPPSVINAYFAEIYQKQGPQAATDYYFQLSKELHFFKEEPSFVEEKPFVRLNLSGKSFGFAYLDETGLAQVFSQYPEQMTASLFFEIAQVFPHYMVFLDKGKIFMKEIALSQQVWQEQESDYLLTQIAQSKEWMKISGLNQEEVLEAAANYSGQTYYSWSGREAVIYISM